MSSLLLGWQCLSGFEKMQLKWFALETENRHRDILAFLKAGLSFQNYLNNIL
jgi:hypothetical protein